MLTFFVEDIYILLIILSFCWVCVNYCEYQ